MTQVTFKNNTPAVERYYKLKSERGLDALTRDFQEKSNRRSPYRSKGALRKWSVTRSNMGGSPARLLRLRAAYAQYQERGSRWDGTRRVRRYTTPGTGRNYVKNAVDQIKPKIRSYFR